MIEWWGEWMNERRKEEEKASFINLSNASPVMDAFWIGSGRAAAAAAWKNAEKAKRREDGVVTPLSPCGNANFFARRESDDFEKFPADHSRNYQLLVKVMNWIILADNLNERHITWGDQICQISRVWSYKNDGPNIFLSWSFSGRKLDSSSMRIVEETDENRRSCSRATIVIFGLRCRAILSISLLLFALFRTIHKSAYRLYSYIFNEFSFFCCSHLVLLFLKGNSLGLCIHSEWEHSQDASLWFSSASSSYLPIIEVP